MEIPFYKMAIVGNEEKYLLEALRSGKWSGRGPKTRILEERIKEICGVRHAYFVTSCSSALEVSCLAARLKPGDEVVMPSFSFVSAANAVLTAGAKPVFADVDLETWNLSAETAKAAITARTRAILTIHYGGSTAGVDELRDLCQQKNFFLIEDAAQSLGAKRKGKPVGATPWAACFSLHETKNISSGEGGFITTDSDDLAQKIEIHIEKGTNRQKFLRGQVDKYTWVDRGSSYVASDLLAAVGLGQIEKLDFITERRLEICERYKKGLAALDNIITWQKVPEGVQTNGHVAAFRVEAARRDEVLAALKQAGVQALFHFVPLHDSPYSRENGLAPRVDLPHTRVISDGLVRLPLYHTMTNSQVDVVIEKTTGTLSRVFKL